jgi:hypothetical protein
MQLERKRRAFASRVAAVHWAVCGLAILAAGMVQIPWDTIFGRPEFAEWQPRVIVVNFAATAWLLATAWLHRELARRGEGRLGLTQNDLRLQLLGDSLLAGIAAAIIWRGHESPLAAVGAWSICPAVLAMGVLSAVGVSLERVVGGGGGHSPPYKSWVVWGRVVLAGALVIVLACLSA